MNAESFELTIPSPGSTTSQRILSLAIQQSAHELLRLEPVPGASRASTESVVRARAAFAAVARKTPGALFASLRRPTVSALLRCQRDRTDLARAARIQMELVATLLLDLALFDVLEAPVRVEGELPRELLSITHTRSAAVTSDVLVFRSGSIEGVAFREGSAPYTLVDGGVWLAERDNNPISMFEAHPDKHGNAIDLGGKPASDWVTSLRDSLALIAEHLPELRRELDQFSQLVVPVGYHAERHESASYREAIGTIYMTLHPHLMTMAEAVIHEGSHNKLNAFFETDEVLLNGDSPLYTSPVRPDPRPLRGVLLAVHAFIPVARLYEKMVDARDARVNPSFLSRFEAVRRINAEGFKLLAEHARPTAKGRSLMDELARWIAHYERYSAPAG
ncbi:MAG: HEXXH motif-containing putative peptide modification protein [Polyangiaceae bacterium]